VGDRDGDSSWLRLRGEQDLDDVSVLLSARPTWAGSLEDVLVALTELKLDVPVWMLNYRDLAAFRNLGFWIPI
jgi:hypothetical protein